MSERGVSIEVSRIWEDSITGICMQKRGVTRRLLRPGGSVDIQHTVDILLRELRSGKIGRISFEEPP